MISYCYNDTLFKYGGAECTLILIHYDVRGEAPKQMNGGPGAAPPGSGVQGAEPLAGVEVAVSEIHPKM